MQLYPAIDMKNGKCVRLKQGVFDDMTVYYESPKEAALFWEHSGGTYLHLVDLDGALAGFSINEYAIKEIIESVNIPVQIGGGIRNEAAISRMLELGVSRVIIGTKAVENPEFIKKMIEYFGSEHIVVGVDAKDGMVAINGWETLSHISASDLCIQMKEYGVKHIVYTDISKDGMLSGPNIESTKKLTELTKIDIIASGGVSCMDDLKYLYEAGVEGAIIGKALYENRINLSEAVKLYE